MIDSWFNKTKLKKRVEDFVRKSLYGKVSANQLTILGLLLGIGSAFFIFLSSLMLELGLLLLIISAVLMSLSFIVDIFDGAMARIDEPTVFGGVLDIFCDRTVEVCIIMALISTDPLNLMWPGIFLLGAIILCLTMFLTVGGAIKPEDLDETQKVIYYRRGLMERTETFIFLVIASMLYLGSGRIVLFVIFGILVLLTAILRLRDAYILLNSSN